MSSFPRPGTWITWKNDKDHMVHRLDEDGNIFWCGREILDGWQYVEGRKPKTCAECKAKEAGWNAAEREIAIMVNKSKGSAW